MANKGINWLTILDFPSIGGVGSNATAGSLLKS